jgi:hypothetical protein
MASKYSEINESNLKSKSITPRDVIHDWIDQFILEEDYKKDFEGVVLAISDRMIKSNGLSRTDRQSINYKFDEENICKEILNFIDKTYSGHYSGKRGEKIQVTEFSLSHCKSPEDALRFNILKYAARYGSKEGYNKNDLLKSAHYLVMMINYHNKYLSKESEKDGR